MKYLKYVEAYTDPVFSIDRKKLQTNIKGLLIDITDIDFSIYISVEDSEYDMNEAQLIVSITKRRGTPFYFIPNDIKPQIDTLIDFIEAYYRYDGLKIHTSQQMNYSYDKIDFDSETATFRMEFEYFKEKKIKI